MYTISLQFRFPFINFILADRIIVFWYFLFAWILGACVYFSPLAVKCKRKQTRGCEVKEVDLLAAPCWILYIYIFFSTPLLAHKFWLFTRKKIDIIVVFFSLRSEGLVFWCTPIPGKIPWGSTSMFKGKEKQYFPYIRH